VVLTSQADQAAINVNRCLASSRANAHGISISRTIETVATSTQGSAGVAQVRSATWQLPHALGLTADISRFKEKLGAWAAGCDPEVSTHLDYQLAGSPKYFRPTALTACCRATTGMDPSDAVVRRAVAVELMHNATLIIDDILDRSRHRRANLSLHCRFGTLPALMVAGYLTAGASEMVADEARSVRLVAEVLQRLAVAECYQWRVRRHPMGVEDWRAVASEDTGSMFQICARLGTGDERLSRYGLLLGILYHGCDDVADVRETAALGGGGGKDLTDGILTLPAALALRDPSAAVLFRKGSPVALQEFAGRLVATLPEAEEYLDRIANEARHEAIEARVDHDRLLALVDYTRSLSTA
jgi:geranylgeranyl pyrophosphate synthase